jgi:hypothetical protein
LRSNAILFQRIDENRRDLLARGKGCAMHERENPETEVNPKKEGKEEQRARSETIRTSR